MALVADARCEALARLRIPHVRIDTAEAVTETVPVCRVRGVASPVPGSRIGFEVWLPREGWNGRYYQLGNGGFAGNIHAPSLAAEAARGNAAAATDTGHKGGGFDASWAAGNRVAVVDYGHRSIKATADAAAVLIRAYYGRSAERRYFAGCSNGGRQALMAAQRHSEDWDGIVVGAPAVDWSRRLAKFDTLARRLRAAPIAASKLPSIQQAALSACPANIAIDPRRCRFDPTKLLCRSVEQRRCLTAAEAESLRRIALAGYEPTGAAVPDNWARWILNPDPARQTQARFGDQARRYLLHYPRPWLSRTLDPAADLRRFRARGGKMIGYFGWADAVLPPRAGLAYYRRAGGPDFFRLFMVPGMTHCQGGVGPTAFGQSPAAPAAAPDPKHDIRAALEAWVERGIAPEVLVAVDPASGGERRLAPEP